MIAEAAELREKVGIVKDLDFVKGPQNTNRLDLVAYLEETAVPAQLSREMRCMQFFIFVLYSQFDLGREPLFTF